MAQNCPFCSSLPLPFARTVIAFHLVNKKSPLIIRIVDRIKINIVPYFLQIERFDIFYVCFVYFAAIAQVWINLHQEHVFYTVMLLKRAQVPRG